VGMTWRGTMERDRGETMDGSGSGERRASWVWPIVVLVLAAGCAELSLVAPGDREALEAELVDGPVRVTLTMTHGVVDPPAAVLAILRYENRGQTRVTVTSGMGCLSFAGVYRGEERIEFPSTSYACTAAARSWELGPGEAIGMEWPLHIGGHDGVPLAPGTYRFVADLNTHATPLVRTFQVR
jgi:hypothetical protein